MLPDPLTLPSVSSSQLFSSIKWQPKQDRNLKSSQLRVSAISYKGSQGHTRSNTLPDQKFNLDLNELASQRDNCKRNIPFAGQVLYSALSVCGSDGQNQSKTNFRINRNKSFYEANYHEQWDGHRRARKQSKSFSTTNIKGRSKNVDALMNNYDFPDYHRSIKANMPSKLGVFKLNKLNSGQSSLKNLAQPTKINSLASSVMMHSQSQMQSNLKSTYEDVRLDTVDSIVSAKKSTQLKQQKAASRCKARLQSHYAEAQNKSMLTAYTTISSQVADA